MQASTHSIVILIVVITILLLSLTLFIIMMLLVYRKKQLAYQKKIKDLKSDYDRVLLRTQLEIQEQTFQNISREIHDNISLSLTLAKLNLNTIDLQNKEKTLEQVALSVDFISKAIVDLSDISRSLNSEIIADQGLIKALEQETGKLEKLGWYKLHFAVTGNLLYMDAQKELVIFRIIQESFNNVLKHAQAKKLSLNLFYGLDHIDITVEDDGIGFLYEQECAFATMNNKAGLNNMKKRAQLINGKCEINSRPGSGTMVKISVPF